MKTRVWLSTGLALVLLAASSGPAGASTPQCQGKPATLWGDNFDNTLIGTAGSDVITGLGGNDTIDGMGGNDLICGDGGDDSLVGNTGIDSLDGGAGADKLDGGPGRDTATYRFSPAFVSADLNLGKADDGFGSTDSLTTIENLTGSNFNDTLTGNAAANTLIGLSGADTLDGLLGVDTANYQASPAAVNVDLSLGTAADGYGFSDSLLNMENAAGSGFDDILIGRAGLDNALSGLGGNDFFDDPSSLDSDTAVGGAGVDTCTVNIETCFP